MTKTTIPCRMTPLTLALVGALGGVSLSTTVHAYQLGDGETATIFQFEKVVQRDTCYADITGDKKAGFCYDPNWGEYSPVRATTNRAGNAVRLIWYGHPGEADGEVPQTGLYNEGVLRGEVALKGGINAWNYEKKEEEKKKDTDSKVGDTSVTSESSTPATATAATSAERNDAFGLTYAEGEEARPKKETNEKAMVLAEGLGNAVDAYGWTAMDNPRDVKIALKTLTNHGDARGQAELYAGQGETWSMIMTNASGNGISIYASTDFGDATELVGDGGSAATSSTGGMKMRPSMSGGSGRMAKSRVARSAGNRSLAMRTSLPIGSSRSSNGFNPSDWINNEPDTATLPPAEPPLPDGVTLDDFPSNPTGGTKPSVAPGNQSGTSSSNSGSSSSGSNGQGSGSNPWLAPGSQSGSNGQGGSSNPWLAPGSQSGSNGQGSSSNPWLAPGSQSGSNNQGGSGTKPYNPLDGWSDNGNWTAPTTGNGSDKGKEGETGEGTQPNPATSGETNTQGGSGSSNSGSSSSGSSNSGASSGTSASTVTENSTNTTHGETTGVNNANTGPQPNSPSGSNTSTNEESSSTASESPGASSGASASTDAESSTNVTTEEAKKAEEDKKKEEDKFKIKLDHTHFGKSMEIVVDKIENTGIIMGTIKAFGHENANLGNPEGWTPTIDHEGREDIRFNSLAVQYMPSVVLGGGNGVSLRTHVWTEDTTSDSSKQTNAIQLHNLKNTGVIQGQATVTSGGGMKAFFTGSSYVRAFNVGNGVQVSSVTEGRAKHKTSAEVGDVYNSGFIDGTADLRTMGNISLEGVLLQKGIRSLVDSKGNGNGLAAQAVTESFTRGTKVSIGNITNLGRFTGSATLETKNGSGDISIDSFGTGNGVSALLKFTQSGTGTADTKPDEKLDYARIGDVDNRGIMSGSITAKPGRVALTNGKEPTGRNPTGAFDHPDEEVKYLVRKLSGDVDKNTPQNPPQPTEGTFTTTFGKDLADKRTQSTKQSLALSTVWASGNGLAILSDKKAIGEPAPQLGTVNNSGVMSGYARMYHGFQGTPSGEDWSRVDYLGAGSGLFLNGRLTNPVSNTGVMAGNVSAMMIQGALDTSQSTFDPRYVAGAKLGSIQNYGLMAGTMIVGHYSSQGINSSTTAQFKEFFDSSAIKSEEIHAGYDKFGKPLPKIKVGDPLDNHGTLVYLKSGVKKEKGSIQRFKDAEVISRVVVADSGDMDVNGTTYHIVNAPLATGKLDSSTEAMQAAYDHYIFNGVGVKKGALHVPSQVTLTNSSVNGFVHGISLNKGALLTLENSTVNVTGFDVRVSKPDTEQDYDEVHPVAIKGVGGQTLTLKSGTIINGDIDLGEEGNNTLIVGSNQVYVNGKQIKLGWDNGSHLQFGDELNKSAGTIKWKSPIEGQISSLTVNQPTELMSTSGLGAYMPNELNLNANLIVHGGLHLGEDHHMVVSFNDIDNIPTFVVMPEGENVIIDKTHLKFKFDRKAVARRALKSGVVKPIVFMQVVPMDVQESGHQPESHGERLRRAVDDGSSKVKLVFKLDEEANDFVEMDAAGNVILKAAPMTKAETKVLEEKLLQVAGTSPSLTAVVKANPLSDIAVRLAFVGEDKAKLESFVLQTQPLLTGSVAPMLERVILGAQDDVKMNLLTAKPSSDKHVWADADGVFGTLKARTGLSGYRANSQRVTFGGDIPVAASTRVGAMLGWATTKAHSKEFVADHTVKAQSFMGSVFVDHRFTPSIVVQGHAGLAHSSIKGDRVIGSDEDAINVTSKYSMDTVFASALLGMPWEQSFGQVIPFVDTNVWMTREGAYTETGAGALALNVQKKTTTNADLGVGLKAQFAMSSAFDIAASTRVGYRLTNPTHEVSARFNQDGAPIFTVKSAEKGRLGGQVGLKANWSITKAASVALQYDASLARGYLGQEVGLRFSMKF